MSKKASSWFGVLLSVPRRPIAPRRWLAGRPAPLIALALILAFSLGARIYQIDQPCLTPCTAGSSQLIGDEPAYVNAARSIAGLPQGLGSQYVQLTRQLTFQSPPAGDDPNVVHPQLAKVVMAGSIELLGDGPWGWRLGSVLFSLIAMGAMYALVTGAGGSRWLAVGTVAVMALDNLMLVEGRIATLDIYALAMMLVAGAFYVRRRPLPAGAALGIGACMKEVALFLLVGLVLFEVVRLAQSRWGATGSGAVDESPVAAIRGLVGCVLCAFATFFALLWVLDLLVPAWDQYTHRVYAGSPFAHFAHMVNVATSLKTTPQDSPLGPFASTKVPRPSITSTPLQWLIDQKPLHFYRGTVVRFHGHPGLSLGAAGNFQDEINPFVIFLTLPALGLAIGQVWRTRDRVALIGAAWGVGVFLPLVFQSEILHRVGYLYYMLIVLPGIYLMTAGLFSWRYVPRLATVVWAGLLVFGFIHLYPLR